MFFNLHFNMGQEKVQFGYFKLKLRKLGKKRNV